MPSFTSDLLTRHAADLNQATHHPFLTAMGEQTLPKSTLATWLAQDLIYMRANIAFVGGMISHLHLPSTMYDARSTRLEFKLLDTLIATLTNVKGEIEWVHRLDEKYDLGVDFDAAPTETTRKYVELFEGAKDGDTVQALVVLWASEMCYSRAWRFADAQRAKNEGSDGEVLKDCINRWANDEFAEFVSGLADICDGLVEGVVAQEMETCEAKFVDVLNLEIDFWPQV